MKIVVLGNRIESGRVFESWRPDCVEALKQLGHQVTALPFGSVAVPLLRNVAKDADMLLWLKDEPPSPAEEVIDALRSLEGRGVVTVALHMDLFHGVERRKDLIGKLPWWTCQYVFTADGGDRDWGGVNHRWFPPAFGTRYLGLWEADDRYRHKATFVGTHSQRIHGDHRGALLQWANGTYGCDFRQYGTKSSPVWGKKLNKLYATADLVLGDSAPAPFYWSDRVPRTLGRGGILAHPRVPGMEEQGFTDDVMILYDRFDFASIKERRDSMTAAEVKTMRENAVQVVRERHIWPVAMTRVLKEVGLA
ncbi:hypothetical protein PXH78_09325 [Mycolicibacterium smegmatis]|uniref:hypothetical protein n=1 Tax=Mycolicibacterium smegmatis TaxID=1772 RepID=UPI0005D784B9|nr:hypothetical protein [Mycolicibacterium smegmatis]MDF1899068.1 hypothetical protein [Mycolicibacterium smegmatis]MDF1904892.1 hypothetical protein [Mycolicibacterium smegmatis]MDF1918761.1 hypothetical protein [Mycolicibacterium smegmatis]MDF1924056.1 hypothetical protein [Mycolicibacterium smegmatis]UAK53342.1 hypothetical protein K8P01_22380 [Mycolicibacterium smegmatis]